MVNFKNRTENQDIIKALIEGKQIQSKFEDEDWDDYDPREFKNFGPWLCTDEYQWRIKPETTSVKFTHEKTVVEEFEFDFEGVKDTLYEKGETIYYIFKNNSGLFCSRVDCSINHDQPIRYHNYVFFTSKEYLYKAWERIPNHLKGI